MHAATHFYGWHFSECPKQGYIFTANRRLQLGELCRPLPTACSGFYISLSCRQFSSALGFSLCIHSLRIDQVCAFSYKHIDIAWDIQSYRFDVFQKPLFSFYPCFNQILKSWFLLLVKRIKIISRLLQALLCIFSINEIYAFPLTTRFLPSNNTDPC